MERDARNGVWGRHHGHHGSNGISWFRASPYRELHSSTHGEEWVRCAMDPGF